MVFCTLVAVLVLICNTGGLLGAELRSSIIGGQDAPKGRWPWMVHLNITSDGIKKWRCGGSILNSEWVLTAANCWDKQLSPNLYRSMAWIGTHSLQTASVRYMGIRYVISHPDYRALNNGYANNLALVRLKKKIRFSKDVAPVTLPSSTDASNPSSGCWITGWGYIGTDVPLPDPEILQQLHIPIIPQSACKVKYPELTDNMLCAGDSTGGKGACKGDYGGPLVCYGTSGFVQVGIMSFENPDGCATPGHVGIYTRVSKYLRFINDYINL